jgi:hypothetical protein
VAVGCELAYNSRDKRKDLVNDVAQLLISFSCAFQVPTFVNNIAAVMPWLLESAPIPLSYCYKTVAINLHFVCDSHGDYHIHPLDDHLSILQVCFNNVLHNFYGATVWVRSEDAVMAYLPIRWGRRIHFAGFQYILLDGYYFIQRHFGYGYLCLLMLRNKYIC